MLYVIERGEILLNIKIDLLKNYYIMQISHKCSLVRNVKNLREIVKPDLHMSTKKSCRIDKFICSLGENETKKGCSLTHFWFCISSHALLCDQMLHLTSLLFSTREYFTCHAFSP